ncbi:MAG: DUF58 domain-containing protein [Lachnospiraceae bacterium]|nr:DUF58 domain-containing protein [Lachnospiraceae bacterium]
MKRRKLIFGAIWLLSLVVISFFGGAVSYGFFFAMTLLPIASLIYLLYAHMVLKVQQSLDTLELVGGQEVPYSYRIKNEGRLGITSVRFEMYDEYVDWRESPKGEEYELMPEDEFVFTTMLSCKYRGEYELGIRKIVATDLLRLFCKEKTIGRILRVKVRPKIVNLNEIKAISEIITLQSENAAEKTEPDAVVRDYVRGDSIKKVHWKASAKTGELKTRTDIGEVKKGISILLDITSYSKERAVYLPLENKMLEVLVSLGYYFTTRHMPVSVFFGKENSLISSLQDFENFYNKTEEIGFLPQESFSVRLQELFESGILSESKVFLGICHELNESIIGVAEQLASMEMQVVLYVVTDEDISQYSVYESANIKIIGLTTKTDLQQEGL